MNPHDKYHIFIVDQKIKSGAYLYSFDADKTIALKKFKSTVSFIRRNYPNLNIKTSTKRFPYILISRNEIPFKNPTNLKSISRKEIGDFLGYKCKFDFDTHDMEKNRYAYNIMVKLSNETKPFQLFAVVDDSLFYNSYYEKWNSKIKDSLMKNFPEVEDVFLKINEMYGHKSIVSKLVSGKKITSGEKKYIFEQIDEYESFVDIIGPKLDLDNPFHRGIVVTLFMSYGCKFDNDLFNEFNNQL